MYEKKNIYILMYICMYIYIYAYMHIKSYSKSCLGYCLLRGLFAKKSPHYNPTKNPILRTGSKSITRLNAGQNGPTNCML